MIIYISLFISIIILAILIFCNGKSKSKNKIFLFCSFGLMLLVMGLRDISVGTDTELYCTIFKNYGLMEYIRQVLQKDTNIIYGLYNFFISKISTDNSMVIFCNSAIILILTAIFIYNNCSNVVFPTLLFMEFYHYFSAFNIARQYIAVLIIANSFYFLKNRMIWQYIGLNIIAIFVHNTASIFLILLPFLFIKISYKNINTLIVIYSIFIFLGEKLINIFINIFPHYAIYLGSQSRFLFTSGENRKIIITFIYIFIALLMRLILSKKNLIKSEEQNKFLLLYFINIMSIIIGVISLKSMSMARIEVYFSFFAIMTIPYCFEYIKRDRLICNVVFIVIMFIPMYIQLLSNNSEVVPYMFM